MDVSKGTNAILQEALETERERDGKKEREREIKTRMPCSLGITGSSGRHRAPVTLDTFSRLYKCRSDPANFWQTSLPRMRQSMCSTRPAPLSLIQFSSLKGAGLHEHAQRRRKKCDCCRVINYLDAERERGTLP